MTDLGDAVLIALADQGFGLRIDEEHTDILSQDRRRTHRLDTGIFQRNDRRSMITLRLVVGGLEFLEGFVAPPGFWEEG